MEASGQFQVQILAVEKIRSDAADSICCGSSTGQLQLPTSYSTLKAANGTTSSRQNQTCSGICRPYVRLCFKEYQRNVNLNGKCSYGEGLSPVLSLPFNSNASDPAVAINLPFNFGWMVSEVKDAVFAYYFTAVWEDRNNWKPKAVSQKQIQFKDYGITLTLIFHSGCGFVLATENLRGNVFRHQAIIVLGRRDKMRFVVMVFVAIRRAEDSRSFHIGTLPFFPTCLICLVVLPLVKM